MPDSEQTTRDAVLALSTPAGETAWNSSEISRDPAEVELSASEPARLPQSHELNQSLARLEMNSHQVRLYLDSIEAKISRMEPRLEQMRDLQQPSPSTQPPSPDSLDQPMPSTPPAGTVTQNSGSAALDAAIPVPIPAESTTERRRRRFDIPPPTGGAYADRLGQPLTESGPLAEEEPWALRPWLLSRRKQLTIAGVIFLAFVTILTFGAGTYSKPTASPTLTANTPASAALGSTAPPKSSAGIPFSEAHETAPSTNPQPRVTTSASSAAGSIPSTAAAAIAGNITNLNARPNNNAADIAGSAPALTQPNDLRDPRLANTPATTRLIPASGRVRVSSGVMAGNLISSRTPKYPGGLAGLFHTEGKVTLQAIIARDGRVENLRVLSGHRLLRGAAQDAVRTWRYRPYLVGGVPVEVATIITVEFHR